MADCKHLGQWLLEHLKKNGSDVAVIDAATGDKETFDSLLSRSVQLARCFRKLNLKVGDVVLVSGPNHIDLYLPQFAACMEGLLHVGLDMNLIYYMPCLNSLDPLKTKTKGGEFENNDLIIKKIKKFDADAIAVKPVRVPDEVLSAFKKIQPNIIFCQSQNVDLYKQCISELKMETKIVTFDGSSGDNLKDFLKQYDDNEPIDKYSPAEFNPDTTYAWLIPTSGSTGLPKFAAFTHTTAKEGCHLYSNIIATLLRSNSDNRIVELNLSPAQWVAAYFRVVCNAVYNIVRVQTSAEMTPDHLIDIIHQHKPHMLMVLPNLVARVLSSPCSCDMSCFKTLLLVGENSPKTLLLETKAKLDAGCYMGIGYGQTETLGVGYMRPVPGTPLCSCGKAQKQYKLIDPESGKEITEPNVPGELWLKGSLMLTEYYNEPEATSAAFSEDGYYKTGDLLYRDENDFFYFVDRIKSLLKWRGHHVLPAEIESVIMDLPGIFQVCVAGLPNVEQGDILVACVVKKEGANITAQEVKDIVREKVSETKHLRGGVVFLDKLPLTSTFKINRIKVKEIVMKLPKERFE